MHKLGRFTLIAAISLLFLFITTSFAQEGGNKNLIAAGDLAYFAGFISENQLQPDMKIVSSITQPYRISLYSGETIYANKGESQGVRVGDVFQIVRPLGVFNHPFKGAKEVGGARRKGKKLGFYNEEIGLARVIAVQQDFSTLEITTSYIDARLGDALIPFQKRDLPEKRPFSKLDPVAISTGKATGQIVFARDSREHLSANDPVIIDLGERDGVKVGDYLTIFRETGSNSIFNSYTEDNIEAKRPVGGSERYRGNNYSLTHTSGNLKKLKKQFPGKVIPRTVVGELVITRVEGTTANAVIVRTQSAQAVIGDMVELQ